MTALGEADKMMKRGRIENALLATTALAMIGVIGGIYLISPASFRAPANSPGSLTRPKQRNPPPAPPAVRNEGALVAQAGDDDFVDLGNEVEGASRANADSIRRSGPIAGVMNRDADRDVGVAAMGVALADDAVEVGSPTRDVSSTRARHAGRSKVALVPLSLSKGRHFKARTWTNVNSSRTVQASIYGADDVSQMVRLKRRGKNVADFPWSAFSDADIEYLQLYCEDARQQLEADRMLSRIISARRVQYRYATSAKIRASTARQASSSARQHAGAIHGYRYKNDKAYRLNFERNANRATSVRRGYAAGYGYAQGRRSRVWVPGRQSSTGTWSPGCWK